MDEKPYVSKVCSLNIKESKCTRGPCDRCCWSYQEIERRRKLPLVKLDNGLYGKRVGRNYAPLNDKAEN